MPHLPEADVLAALGEISVLTAPGMPRCRELVDSLFLGVSNVKRYDTHFVFSVVKHGLEIPMQQRDG